MYKKIRHYVWTKESGYHGWEQWRTSLNFTWQLEKEIKWNASNKAVSSKRNDEIWTHICSTEWAILLKLRYVSCKVWAKVVCCKLKLLHCQDSFSAARQISVALLTKRSKSTSRLLRRWDDIGLGFSALGRDTWHPKSTLHWLKATTSVSVSDEPSRSDPASHASTHKIERRSIMKRKHLALCPSRLCLSSLLTSQWVLCQLEVCPYKPRGLSLLWQSVVG